MFGLIPWRGRTGLADFHREMEEAFGRLFDEWPFGLSLKEGDWVPPMDISESGKNLVAKVEVPGIDPKDIDISLQGGVLTVRGERKQEKEEREENFHRVERRYGSFCRSIRLPAEVNTEKVKAAYKDGVLTITMPKAKEEATKRIEVKAA